MRLIEIPDDGIIKEFIWRGDSVVGKRCIDLSYMPTIKAEPVRWLPVVDYEGLYEVNQWGADSQQRSVIVGTRS